MQAITERFRHKAVKMILSATSSPSSLLKFYLEELEIMGQRDRDGKPM